MSIQSEITRISGNVSDALTAIGAKGVTVPSGATSDDLADLIGARPSPSTAVIPQMTITQMDILQLPSTYRAGQA